MRFNIKIWELGFRSNPQSGLFFWLGYKMDDIVNSTDKELEGILSDRDLAVLRGVVLDLKGGEDS